MFLSKPHLETQATHVIYCEFNEWIPSPQKEVRLSFGFPVESLNSI